MSDADCTPGREPRSIAASNNSNVFVSVSVSVWYCSEGWVCVFNTDAGLCLPHYQPCHADVVHSVDFTSSVMVSGSRDATVKVSQGHSGWFKVIFDQSMSLSCKLRLAARVVVVFVAVYSGWLKKLNHHRHNPFTGLFPRPPGWACARRELQDFMVKGKINRGRHTDHPVGRHSIRTNQCPPPPRIFYRPDALPDAQLTASKDWRQLAHLD